MSAFSGMRRALSFGFNPKNQITNSGFAYDGNGNPTTYKGQTLTFDPENRMTSYGNLMTAGYRSDGLRAWKQSNGSRTYYFYGAGQLLFEVTGGYITARNVFGPDGLVARTGSGGTWVSYTFDQQGNVTHRTDPSGNVLGNYGSDAYGNPISWANSTAPYDYNGQWGYYKDVETGLYYCQNRYYDPVNGRWLTQDPIGMSGGINQYGYCLNKPLAGIDPNGHGLYQWMLTGDWNANQELYDAKVQELSDEIYGYHTEDPDGYPVIIGGIPNAINRSGNAMTYGGNVHLYSAEDFDDFCDSGKFAIKWRKHEHWHFHQEKEYFDQDTLAFTSQVCREYIVTRSHDNAPLEINADNHNGVTEWQNPWSKWPSIAQPGWSEEDFASPRPKRR